MRLKSGSPEINATYDIRKGVTGQQCRFQAKEYSSSNGLRVRENLGRWLQSYDSCLDQEGYKPAVRLTSESAKIVLKLRRQRNPVQPGKVLHLPKGLFSVTSRNRGQYGERWYCRVSVPLAVADAAGWRSGMTVAASRDRDRLRFTIDDDAKLTIPEAKRRKEKTRSLEFAVGDLNLGFGAAQEIDVRFDDDAVIADICLLQAAYRHEGRCPDQAMPRCRASAAAVRPRHHRTRYHDGRPPLRQGHRAGHHSRCRADPDGERSACAASGAAVVQARWRDGDAAGRLRCCSGGRQQGSATRAHRLGSAIASS